MFFQFLLLYLRRRLYLLLFSKPYLLKCVRLKKDAVLHFPNMLGFIIYYSTPVLTVIFQIKDSIILSDLHGLFLYAEATDLLNITLLLLAWHTLFNSKATFPFLLNNISITVSRTGDVYWQLASIMLYYCPILNTVTQEYLNSFSFFLSPTKSLTYRLHLFVCVHAFFLYFPTLRVLKCIRNVSVKIL